MYTSSIPVTQLQYIQQLLLSILYRLLCFLQLLSCPISGRSAPGAEFGQVRFPHRYPVVLQYINTSLSVLVLVKSGQIVLSEFLTSYVHRCSGLGVVLGGPRRCFLCGGFLTGTRLLFSAWNRGCRVSEVGQICQCMLCELHTSFLWCFGGPGAVLAIPSVSFAVIFYRSF